MNVVKSVVENVVENVLAKGVENIVAKGVESVVECDVDLGALGASGSIGCLQGRVGCDLRLLFPVLYNPELIHRANSKPRYASSCNDLTISIRSLLLSQPSLSKQQGASRISPSFPSQQSDPLF